MQTRKRYEKASVTLNGAVPSMLRKAKTVLSCKQYRELCTAVNEAADYTTKKGLISACLQAKRIICKPLVGSRNVPCRRLFLFPTLHL